MNGGSCRSSKLALRLLLPLRPGGRRRLLLRSRCAAQSRTCADGYTYAGRLSATRAHGVRATLTALSKPEVAAGHVAAWVGVGGAGQGVNGTDAWIQIGLSAFPGSESRLYYEIAGPACRPPTSSSSPRSAPASASSVAVLEMAQAPDYWRVWLNGKPVSAAGRAEGLERPLASDRNGRIVGRHGQRAATEFNYRFESVRIAAATGGSWQTRSSAATRSSTPAIACSTAAAARSSRRRARSPKRTICSAVRVRRARAAGRRRRSTPECSRARRPARAGPVRSCRGSRSCRRPASR